MTTKTFADVLDDLKRETEVDILEILDLSSEELVDLLQDTIEDKLDKILQHYEDSEESYVHLWVEELPISLINLEIPRIIN